MRRTAFLAVLVLLLVTGSPARDQKSRRPAGKPPAPGATTERGLSPALPAAVKTIDPERIRAHVKFLSDDLLEGRGTGQRGGDIAAAYLATQFEIYGLKPAGDNNTFLQKVPLVGSELLPESTVTIVPQKGEPLALKHLDQYVAVDETQQPDSEVDAGIVFVGYGIEAPEYKWNDYKDVDVHGKVLLMLVNEPPSNDPGFFQGKALTYYGRWTYKYEEAARKGAVGAMLIHRTDMASYGWEVLRNSGSGEDSALALNRPVLKIASWVQLDVARKMARLSGKDLDQMIQAANSPDFHPVSLPLRLKAHLVSKVRHFTSNNVVAELPGADPYLREEAVLYTAHYDHLGVGADVQGDNIYNGANDNATGCAMLLEMARAFASSSPRPSRTIIFAAVTAEEQGLLGSDYLAKHPPLAAGRISLSLNFDDVKPWGIPEQVEVTGAERTNFYAVAESTANQFGLSIKPEANPGAGQYYRSDHFSLARVGVPSFSVQEGLKFKGHSLEWGVTKDAEYTQKHYHQPSDEYRPEMDFSGNALIAQYGFALGWQAASQPKLVEWKPGDEFEAARLKSESASGGR